MLENCRFAGSWTSAPTGLSKQRHRLVMAADDTNLRSAHLHGTQKPQFMVQDF
jgi:hypothetical protein